jgi:pyridinium-3,5-bisthiocarboxylic acid mononucleotide nickel chelatase
VTTLWIDPSFGASGDMLLGALVGLGADVAAVRSGLASLPVTGWTIEASTTTRGGLSADRVTVTTHDHSHHRRWSEIDAMLAAAEALPARVRDGARRTFRRLGEIEASAHAVPLDAVHFHEVGAVDAIVDVVGVWLAIDLIGVAVVVSGPVGLGHGTVRGAHGVLPLPAPATAALLAGAPVRSLDVEMETCTPTGAALLATLGTWGPIPSGVLLAQARGAGGRDPAGHPNVVTAHLVATGVAASDMVVGEVLLETNLDDVTPEVIGHTIDRLLAAGADDAWAVPIVMKKSRPAFELRVLCAVALAPSLRQILSEETGTLGIREVTVAKHVHPRHVDEVEIDGVIVRIKVGPHGAKPEHDDLVAAARATGRPLRALAAEAVARHASR